MNPQRRPSLAALTALTALLASSPAAHAQATATTLPLTSIGDRLLWTVGDQVLTLQVPVAGPMRLDLYSPATAPTDYRSDTYYGDEQYSSAGLTTTFTLRDAAGQVIAQRTFTAGEHDWTSLIDQHLAAGQYQLTVRTQGAGKNTFAVRLTGVSGNLEADQLSVNIHARDWVPALTVTTDGAAPYVLRMYDGDGTGELQGRLRDAQGRVTALPVSADRAWVDLPLPQAAGQYTVELRQPPGAQQFSNTAGFSLLRAGSPTPLTLTRVDQTGELNVTAELVLPGSAQPTRADVQVGAAPVTIDGQYGARVAAGTYEITPVAIPGAVVTAEPSVLSVPLGGAAQARVQIRPQVQLDVNTDKTSVCVGDTVTVTARATTAFTGTLPQELSVNAPGLSSLGSQGLPGTFNAETPGVLTFTATATTPGPVLVTATLTPWGTTARTTVNVMPHRTDVQLRRATPGPAQVGDDVTVTLTLTNTGAVPVPYTLTDQPGAGLTALDPTVFTGTLTAGETRTVAYRARVTAPGDLTFRAALDTPGCAVTQTADATLQAVAPPPAPAVPVTDPTPATPLAITRVSTVQVPFLAPIRDGEVVIAHQVPDGAAYAPGTAQLDGQPLPDPLRGPSGTLYWTLPSPSAERHVITYDLTHTRPLGPLPSPALMTRTPQGRTEVLRGTLDLRDFNAAQPLQAQQTPTENAGQLKLPLQGTVLRTRDRVSVVIEAPAGDLPTLTVNGEAVGADRIGTVTEDPAQGTQRVTFVGVPLRAGPNELRAGNDTVTVQVVGPTATLQVIPLTLQADGSTPLRVKIRALDAAGQLTAQPSVTIRSTPEPLSRDADPGEGGHQLRLENGEGILELQPQTSPTTLTLDIPLGSDTRRFTFDVTPAPGRVGIGVISATVGLDGNFNVQDDVSVQARAYYEGPLGGGKLYAAADKDGLPTDTDTLKRNPVAGDASTEQVPLQGIDPVAFLYDHPAFRVAYRRAPVPIDVLPVGEQLTALTLGTKTTPGVSAFAAMVPNDRVTGLVLTPESTRLLRLPNTGISEGSETLELVTLEPRTDKELSRVTLTRNVDYVLDVRTGVITFARAIEPIDARLNTVRVYASYRLDRALDQRDLAYGAQLRYAAGPATFGVAAVHLDGQLTLGARATYDTTTLRADTRVAYAGGLQVSADLTAKPRPTDTFSARVRYQDPGYQGLAPFTPGLTTTAAYTAQIGPVTALADAEYHDTPAGQGGSLTGRATTQLGPFSVGGGLKAAFGDTSGLGAVASLGYHQDPLDVDVVHTQPLTGNLDTTTTLSVRYRLTRQVTLSLTDTVTWGKDHTALLSLDSRVGNTTYAASYELPTASGAGNRARFGVTTALPLNDHLTLGLRGSATASPAAPAQVSGGADLTYRTDTVTTTLATDLTLQAGQFGVVVRSGVTGRLTDQLTLTADGLAEFGLGKRGARASLGYAYRSGTFNSLGYVRYAQGTLTNGTAPELSAGASAEWHQADWAVRAGVDTRTLLNNTDTFTAQASLGGTYYLTDRFGLGAWGRVLTQPASSSQLYGLGLEASVRALPGTWLTAGYNLLGFEGLPSNTYTRPGLYLRLDLTLDETIGGQK